jgi:hypothetical protein
LETQDVLKQRAAPAARPVARLMTPAKESVYRRLLPKVDDEQMQSILDDPTLILYTDDEMPRAYQFWNGAFPGIHAVNYNISANDSEPFGNGNREFPWGAPAGTHRAANVRSFRFVWLPKDHAGNAHPIVWYQKRLQGDNRQGYAWTYPVGTVVGEVLCQRGPDGHDYTFELRVRVREAADWAVDVYRPFPSADDLMQRIAELRPEWRNEPKLVALADHLSRPLSDKLFTLADYQPGKRVFSQQMAVDELPPIDDDRLVAELLTTTKFRSAHSTAWRVSPGGKSTAAPTTRAGFHIVPANYDAGFVEVDRQSCQRCHNTVNHDVDEFNGRRDWYGRIRGSDGIFSFHPFEPSSISGNGYPVGVRLRSQLQRAGVLARYDARKHRGPLYHTIRHLVE